MTLRAGMSNEDAMQPMWGQRFGPVQMDLRPTSNHEKPLWGRASALRLAFGPARNFTSADYTGDLVASVRPPRSFTQARGWFFNAAAELPLGARRQVNPGSLADPVADDPANRFFNAAKTGYRSHSDFWFLTPSTS